MALVKCPECGRENVSDTAQCCPECGFGIHDYFVQRQNEQTANENAVSAAQKAKVRKEKEAEELKRRLANIKSPEKPRKGVYIAGGVVCGMIGALWMALALLIPAYFLLPASEAPLFFVRTLELPFQTLSIHHLYKQATRHFHNIEVYAYTLGSAPPLVRHPYSQLE